MRRDGDPTGYGLTMSNSAVEQRDGSSVPGEPFQHDCNKKFPNAVWKYLYFFRENSSETFTFLMGVGIISKGCGGGWKR